MSDDGAPPSSESLREFDPDAAANAVASPKPAFDIGDPDAPEPDGCWTDTAGFRSAAADLSPRRCRRSPRRRRCRRRR